ncbi:MAG: hypothetical protein GIS02_04180 [Methanosarcinales archaeon]|uniref:Uncharacterized protein n=1 Tax=Candidatus Ethanoperedens thermophilum TaxID=2766897 RepID=A0A848DBT3_9EURY|nr:hypothetical protein [Candidatus Ethanoperedens thermophilum]
MFLVLAILSSPIPTITPEVREKTLDLLKIKDLDDFVPFKKVIDSIGGAGGSASLALQSGDSPPPLQTCEMLK